MKSDVVRILIEIATPLLLALAGYLGKLLADLIKAKVHNVALQGALVRLQDAAGAAVKDVMVTYVDAMKEAAADGKLTDEEKAAAKAKALAKAKAILGFAAPSDQELETRIEAAVYDLQRDPTLPPLP